MIRLIHVFFDFARSDPFSQHLSQHKLTLRDPYFLLLRRDTLNDENSALISALKCKISSCILLIMLITLVPPPCTYNMTPQCSDHFHTVPPPKGLFQSSVHNYTMAHQTILLKKLPQQS